MLNLGNPEIAFETSKLPNSGVGLARMEFIINNSIRIHPNALLNFAQLPQDIQQKIKSQTQAYDDPVTFYTQRLAEGIATIAAAFYPKPVIVRLSDFKSNEYAALLGGDILNRLKKTLCWVLEGQHAIPVLIFARPLP